MHIVAALFRPACWMTAVWTAMGSVGAAVRPAGLRCEGSANPSGVEAERPVLSWRLEGAGRGLSQKAYRVIAASKWIAAKDASESLEEAPNAAGLLLGNGFYSVVHQHPSGFDADAWQPVAEAQEVRFIGREDGWCLYALGSGKYDFEFPLSKPGRAP